MGGRLGSTISGGPPSGRVPRARVRRHLGPPDKGQRAQIKAFLDAVRTGGPMPISLESLTATTRATLAAAAAGVASGTPAQL